MKKILSILILSILAACGGQDTQEQPKAEAVVVTKTSAKQGGVAAPAQEVKIAGYRDAYEVQVEGTWVTVTKKSDKSVQTFSTSQVLYFFDRVISFNIEGAEGQAYRLYQAAFNRKPDLPGLGYWIANLASGSSIQHVSSQFQSSAEFQNLYGSNVSSDKWITLVYNNVLHRTPDDGGFKWWVNALNAGNDRSGALVGFSESAENKANLASAYAHGIEYQKYGGPVVPQRSSYLNAKNLNIPSQTIPTNKFVAGSNGWSEGFTGGIAFGDFLQDGSIQMVGFSNIWMNDSNADWKAGSVYFFKYVDGQPVDITESLIKDATGCIAPRKVIVADFNNDGRPDVFASCHGSEKKNTVWTGTNPRVLLSNADGTYKNVQLPVVGYFHAATAGDIDSDGAVDIILYDGLKPGKSPSEYGFVYLMGKGDGTFAVDTTDRVRKDLNQFAGSFYATAYSMELIDMDGDGVLDLISGSENDKVWNSRVWKGNANGTFTSVLLTLPPHSGSNMFPLDWIFINERIYMYSAEVNTSTGDYNSVDVFEFDMLTKTEKIIYKSNGAVFETWGKDLVWIMPYQNRIVPYNKALVTPSIAIN